MRRLRCSDLMMLAGWLLSVDQARADDDPCAALPKPAVKLDRFEPAVAYDHRYSYRILTRMAGERQRPNQTVLGLTRGKAVAKVSLQLPRLSDASGRWECASPQIVVQYGFAPLVVHVAREFPAGTCAHREILAHEQRHVEVYRQHAQAIEETLRSVLASRFTADAGVWRGAAGSLAARLQDELNQRWLPFVQRQLALAESAQAEVDALEEYARVAASCDGEIGKRLRADQPLFKP